MYIQLFRVFDAEYEIKLRKFLKKTEYIIISGDVKFHIVDFLLQEENESNIW